MTLCDASCRLRSRVFRFRPTHYPSAVKATAAQRQDQLLQELQQAQAARVREDAAFTQQVAEANAAQEFADAALANACEQSAREASELRRQMAEAAAAQRAEAKTLRAELVSENTK